MIWIKHLIPILVRRWGVPNWTVPRPIRQDIREALARCLYIPCSHERLFGSKSGRCKRYSNRDADVCPAANSAWAWEYNSGVYPSAVSGSRFRRRYCHRRVDVCREGSPNIWRRRPTPDTPVESARGIRVGEGRIRKSGTWGNREWMDATTRGRRGGNRPATGNRFRRVACRRLRVDGRDALSDCNNSRLGTAMGRAICFAYVIEESRAHWFACVTHRVRPNDSGNSVALSAFLVSLLNSDV